LPFFCSLFRPVLFGGLGVESRCGSALMYCGGVAMLAGLPGPLAPLLPVEGGMGWAPAGLGRPDGGVASDFLGSGSGAQDSMGRWSDGSTSFPSWEMILPFVAL
jgi:hypothetical protein